MSFAIVTDSSANLPNELIDRYGLHILSLRFLVSDREYYSYIKGEDNDLQKFYSMMRNKEDVKTSHINPALCTELFEGLIKEGQDVLFLGFSSALSGTFETAQRSMNELREQYPERKLFCIDTKSASLGQGLLVTLVVKLKEKGADIEECAKYAEELVPQLCHWFTVDDLFFLKRGGRVNAATAILGSMLGIKPVLHMDDEGRLINVTKVRGRKASLDMLVKKMEELAVDPEKQTIYISHGDCIEDAQYVADEIKAKWGVEDILIHYVDPVIGAHSGPGTVALFFIGQHR